MSQSALPQLIHECVEQGVKLQELERSFITAILDRTEDNKITAANELGIQVRALYKKIHQLQIKRFKAFPVAKKDIFLSANRKLGGMIRQARMKKDMNPKELAYFLGYKTETSVFHIESGRRSIPKKIVPRLASTLGIPTSTLQQAIMEAKLEGKAHEHSI